MSFPPGFEWFVAWRHLRDPDRRSRRTLIVGIVLIALGALALAAAHLFGRRLGVVDVFPRLRSSLLLNALRDWGIVGLILGAVVTYLGLLLAAFTVFTAISIFGVFLGTFLPVVTLSVMSGFETDLKTKIRGAKADVVITAAEDRPFVEWAPLRGKIAGIPGVVASTPYLEAEVMIKAGGTTAGILVRGIDPASAPQVLDLGRTLRDGKIDHLIHPERVAPSALDRPREDGSQAAVLPAIIIGEELHRTLRTYMGSEVTLICPLCKIGPSGPLPYARDWQVAGRFYSGMFEFDSKLAYVTLEQAQRFLSVPGEVTGIDVRARTPEDAQAVADAVQAAVGPGYEVRTWEDLNRGLFMALRLEKIAMFVVLAFIALVASFSIISTLIMSVTQKAREVAILKSLGAPDGAIRRIFFAEGITIGLLGLSVGVASGILACRLIMRYGLPLPADVYYIDQLPVVMRAGEIGAVAALALALCSLATVYPAMLASRLRPVEGLRYE